jgi:hypothetical protein
MKMSLELVPRDAVDIGMGVGVRLPPVGYRSIELVHGKKNFLTIRASITSFFSTPLSQSLASIGSLAYEKVVG